MIHFSNKKRTFFGMTFLLMIQVLYGQTFSLDRLESFYDTFVCEEKDVSAEVALTGPCTPTGGGGPIVDGCGTLLDRPTIAPLAAQAPSTDYIPFVLVNNTGQDVYIVIYGRKPTADACTDGDFNFIDFGAPAGPIDVVGGYAPAVGMNMPPSSDYSYNISDIPQTNGQTILYVPYISSGIILYSIGTALDLTVENNSIAIPVVTDSGGDANYNTVYGGMELTFTPTSCPGNQLTVDFTCVDYYGLSIYFNLFTQNPLPGLPQNRPSGIYQSRHHTLCELQNSLATATADTLSQWNGLVLKDGDKILRVVSPGYSMSHTGGTFDTNYFDNAATYGYSWANDVWTGADAYYLTRTLTVITNNGTQYTGKIIDGDFVFQSTTTDEQFGVPWSNVPVGVNNFTTSTALFNVATYFPGMTYSADRGATSCEIGSMGCSVPGDALGRATEITEYVSASMAVALLPGKVNKVKPTSFPPSLFNSYNTPNTNLKPPGTTTGPWYDLYSLGIVGNSNATGNSVYTYAYDDYLYHQAPIKKQVAPSQATIDATTFISVVLGPYTDN